MKQFRWLTALVVGAFVYVGTAWAASVSPTVVLGNPTCADLGFTYEVKSDSGLSNFLSVVINDMGTSVMVEIDVVVSGTNVSFESNVPVLGVIVKGGPNANLYDYAPGGVLSNSGLTTPINPDNGMPYGVSHVSFCFDSPVVPYSALGVSKDAFGTYSVDWELEKDVDPDAHSGNAGELAGTSTWTVVATKTVSYGLVEGKITITNPNAFDVDFEVDDVLSDGAIADVDCPTYTVSARDGAVLGEVVCTYETLPVDPAVKPMVNTVTVTAIDVPMGFPQADPVDEPIVWSTDDPENGTLTDERLKYKELISETTTVEEDEDFYCSTDASLYTNGSYSYEVENIAYLNDRINLSASATVTVTCTLPALEVKKTAEGSFDRTVEWDLEKSVDPDEHTGYAGELAGSSIWTVVATKSETLGNYLVTGDITITNNAAIDQAFSVSDVLDDGTVADVTCPVTLDNTGTVLAGDSVTCSYTASAPDDSVTLNTAAVSAAGNANQTATAPVSFTENLIGDDEATLSDPRVSFSQLISSSTTKTFPEDFSCPADASLYTNGVYEYTVTNTAYLDGDNTDLEASADVTVTCYIEQLEVSKTVDTSFTREHFWSIDKSVDTENGYELDGFAKVWLYIDGSGDETATWTVDVTYEGDVDSNFNVSGNITIENAGFDAVITDVDDLLGGTEIDVDCGVEFPYTLPAGATLMCSYDEDGYVEGDNVVTVTTERDTYDATEPIVWGEPTNEINATITVMDDMYGVDPLGTVTAPNDAQFTYTKDYAWADYDAEGCGSFAYLNTASIVETKQSASATLKVNVQCYLDDTAYAMGDYATCFIPEFSQWGWTNEAVAPGTYTWPVYAGAADCDLDKGTYVGDVTVVINGGVNWTFDLEEGIKLMEEHVYAGSTMFPQVQRGRRTVDTVAPGQYYIEDDLSGDIYVIVHAVVMYPDPNFGPMD